jgi:hypothetical protein
MANEKTEAKKKRKNLIRHGTNSRSVSESLIEASRSGYSATWFLSKFYVRLCSPSDYRHDDWSYSPLDTVLPPREEFFRLRIR